jgi:tetratricopeptide (TPR) repeat protein
MWIDADEYVDEENQAKLIELKGTLDKDIDSVITYWQRDGIWSHFQRIESRRSNPVWESPWCEMIPLKKRYLRTDIRIHEAGESIPSRGKTHERIIDRLREIGAPISADRCRIFAMAYQNGKRFEDAVVMFRRAIGHPDSNLLQVLFSLGQIARIQCDEFRNHREAIRTSSRMVHEVLAARQAGYEENAIPKQELAEVLDGILFDAYQLLVAGHLRSGHLEEAVKYNRLASRIKPNSPSVRLNAIYFARAICRCKDAQQLTLSTNGPPVSL